ncbi:hypothetical protein ncot_18090 [Nocardioides sp. JQ2195]|uniref:hypothetical protein n=1 Tax=Nocardioides sp. JQ2195 TaxID=2592334 RepID=UPI00143ED63A|nr:hypothetical protein [Nocardioides sp. JQ2195]QIX28287.1 hypothetical protein ncot_18090 [Nocardioides sp. JQ2195]
MSETVLEDTIALTVHGSAGAVDLVVPLGASASDVAREYAAQSGSVDVPRLVTLGGRTLPASTSMEAAGLKAGAMLVASAGDTSTPGPATNAAQAPAGSAAATDAPGTLPVLTGAAVLAVAGALVGVHADGWQRDVVLGCLAFAAALGVLPVGRHLAARGVAAPAFGAALGYLLVWEPGVHAQPLTIGVAGLGAALVAGTARASGAGAAVVHTVWMVAGIGTFLVSGAVVLTGAPPHLTWAVLLIAALLATRSVVAVAIDVPDQMLIDLERLAVTAWSARDRPRGRRGRIMIRESAVGEVLARGTRIVDAACVAILVLVLVTAPKLLTEATYDVDRQGALCLVFFTGAGILLAARSFRHPRARALLRAAGLFAWATLAVDLLSGLSERSLLWVLVVSLASAAGALAAAVATGRGWRSARWASKAELAETLAGAFAIASLVVASGLMRLVWEIPFVA